jgi:hypothetical protein
MTGAAVQVPYQAAVAGGQDLLTKRWPRFGIDRRVKPHQLKERFSIRWKPVRVTLILSRDPTQHPFEGGTHRCDGYRIDPQVPLQGKQGIPDFGLLEQKPPVDVDLLSL